MKGLHAFERQIRSKYESGPNQDEKKEPFPGYARRRWGGALKTLLIAQRNVDAYIALCEETGVGAEECKNTAEMYLKARRLDEAFAWVEHGLEITRSDSRSSFAGHGLREMKRALLTKLGRAGDALESAWSEFQQHSNTFTYKTLMRYVPAKEKKAWREKAMAVSENGDLSSQIELWLENKEIDRLVLRLRKATDKELEDFSHYKTEPLARKLARAHPDIAARVYRALCMRIVNAGKSKYYDAALDNLEQARKCYAKAGLETDWRAVVADVRKRHYRKKGFIAGFEEIVSGAPKRPEPTFMERAERRWPRGGKR